mgnify:CR=1 FL=1
MYNKSVLMDVGRKFTFVIPILVNKYPSKFYCCINSLPCVLVVQTGCLSEPGQGLGPRMVYSPGCPCWPSQSCDGDGLVRDAPEWVYCGVGG